MLGFFWYTCPHQQLLHRIVSTLPFLSLFQRFASVLVQSGALVCILMESL